MNRPDTSAEWSYAQDDLGIVYCLGHNTAADTHEMVAAYYSTDAESATKQTLDAGTYYRRLIYQGLPEERERLIKVERPEVVERLLAHTPGGRTGMFFPLSTLTASDPVYRTVTSWVQNEHPKAKAFQSALHIAGTVLSSVGVSIDELFLYGGASFGVVNSTEKIVDDVDFVFSPANKDELTGAVAELQSSYTWDEIDPFGRLPKERQLLKAKRWATSQIRLAEPYALSIDLKVARTGGDPSLWDRVPEYTDSERFIGELKVINDNESLCTSPALQCEDSSGNERTVLLEGYQYIGCAVAGDVITVMGKAYHDSSIVHVTQSTHDSVTPDFRNIPIS